MPIQEVRTRRYLPTSGTERFKSCSRAAADPKRRGQSHPRPGKNTDPVAFVGEGGPRGYGRFSGKVRRVIRRVALSDRTSTNLMGAPGEENKDVQMRVQGSLTPVLDTQRGSGRVMLRKKQLERGERQVQWKGNRLTSLPQESLDQGEREGDPKIRYPKELAKGWVYKASVENPVELSESMKRCRRGDPVTWRKTPLVDGLLGKWTFEYLSFAMGKLKKDHIVHVSESEKHRFLHFDGSKNLYGSMYHVREPETIHMKMSFSEFADCAYKWNEKRPMMEVPLMDQVYIPGSQEPPIKEEIGQGVRDDLCSLVNWEWYKNLLSIQQFGPIIGCMLSCSTSNALIPARYKEWDTFLVQVTGRRRVLLIDPMQAFDGMYPYAVAHPYDMASMVDFDSPDYGQWPKFSRVQGLVCILEPGDVLYVPRYWFHHVQTLEREEVSLELTVGPGNRVLRDACFPLAVSRLLETRLVYAEGLEGARLWLERISNTEEYKFIDWKTVAGFKRIQLVQMVKDEIEETMGKGNVSTYLSSMIDGRMLPTPWLNKNFREPLYLQDRPFLVEDTRTDWERKYPELFRKKLLQEGYEVQPTPSTVPIPGYNMPKDADWRTWGLR